MSEIEQCPALILTPSGRDLSVAQELLSAIGINSRACADVRLICAELSDDICCAIVADEALQGADTSELTQWIASQPPWSDLPFIVLTRRSGATDRRAAAKRLTTALGNVTFIERPFHPTTFVSVVETAVRGRRRQFEARARIQELHEGEARLRTAFDGRAAGFVDLGSGYLDAYGINDLQGDFRAR